MIKDGTNQSDRLIPALMPGNIEIESRDMTGFLHLAAELSSQFNFYDFTDSINGDWNNFFDSDINIWAALLSRMEAVEFSKTYEKHRASLHFADTDSELAEDFRQLFSVTHAMAQRLMAAAGKIRQLDQPANIKAELDELSGSCRNIIMQLSRYNYAAQQRLGHQVKVEGLDTGNMTLATEAGQAEFLGEGGNTRKQVLQSLQHIHAIFTELLAKFNRLSGMAAWYVKAHPVQQQQYPAHLALFITFLHLYDYLRGQINQLTQRHLDFYYRDILKLLPQPEYPDKVHILFETEPNVYDVLLKAGEVLVAEIPGRDDPVKYRLLDNIVVTKAQVASLYSLFISEQPVFSDDTGDPLLQDVRIFTKQHPVIGQEDMLKASLPVTPWALFGEDQTELAVNQRTMQDAGIGLVVASPLLFLTEGKRNITLKFYFEPATFRMFEEYVAGFARAAKKAGPAVLAEILPHAFVIDFTTAGGWLAVDKYTVSVPGDGSIEFHLELDAGQPAVSIYDPVIHGPDYDTRLPAVRLLINNDNSHNAFSFLRRLVMERIQITARVSGFRDVTMQNAIGGLSPLNPFQPFGPQPFIGSYLDIRNTNVFNRYTTAVAVRFDWLELPKLPGGFTTWFAAYDAGIRNESYKVSISALSDGRNRPAPEERQQERLFHTSKKNGDEILEDTTVIKDIDCKKLEFFNEPLLEKEAAAPDQLFASGAIRFELVSPSEAFGHQLFPRIFPGIALHNSRRFGKKLPLPEQPYIPRARSVALDYTLEYAEAFKEDSAEAGGGIELIHQYPFGHKKIYPGSSDRSFMPRFDDPCNVYIGLRELQPGSELTLLFQLEETSYHHTLHRALPVQWSYLYDDNWVALGKKNVVADSTNNFINTGIVKLRIPAGINEQHTVLPAGLCWIRASVKSQAGMHARVVAVYTQAALTERILGNVTGSDFYLPPGAVQGFTRKMPGIRSTWQLFSSFNGRPAEDDQQYYIRISERLRHKQRPVTTRDIEQFVLQQFPSILMVKCFGTTHGDPPVYPGVNIQVVVLPKERPDGSFFSEQPRVNLATLFSIRQYLSQYIAPLVNLEVGNPVYEKVKIVCTVAFVDQPFGTGKHKTADSGYHLRQLQEDIKAFFCPWLFRPGAPVRMGARIYLSEILTFLKKLPYLSEVTEFSVVHFFREKDINTGELKACVIDSAVDDIDFLQGSVAEAVLIASEHHLISVKDATGYAEPVAKGIRDFIIGEELLVAERKHPAPPDATKREGSSSDEDEFFDIAIGID